MNDDRDVERWEREMKRSLEDWKEPEKARQRKPFQSGPARRGLRVRLAVRMKQLSTDYIFVFESTSISPLQARIEAERAARDDGWLIVGYVIDYEKM